MTQTIDYTTLADEALIDPLLTSAAQALPSHRPTMFLIQGVGTN